MRPNGKQNNECNIFRKSSFLNSYNFLKVTLKKIERSNFRLLILLYFSVVCFLICIMTFCTGQLDELYPKMAILLPDRARVTKYSNILLLNI